MIEIELTQGFVAKIDDDDYELVSRYKWRVKINKYRYSVKHYAFTQESRKIGAKGIYMHRLIMDAKKGQDIDHKNHNSLHNRKDNLRECSRSENLANQRKTRGKSKYKGVIWNKQYQQWQAQICIKQKRIKIGIFATEELAARAYDGKARELFGEYACVNFPKHPNERCAL